MAIEYSQLRQIVLVHLSKLPPDGVEEINFKSNNWVSIEARKSNLDYTDKDRLRVLEIFHELYREGIIVSGSTTLSSSGAMEWPHYRLTEYGRKVLAQSNYVPHDPEGFIAQLNKDIPRVDSTVIRYLEESLGCFKAGHMLGAAVMLGCASEKAMLLVLDAFSTALADKQEQLKFKSIVEKQWMISRKCDELKKVLNRKLDKLPTDLSEDLNTRLDQIFGVIRSARNDAGHPTGKTIDRVTMHANLILFPMYCRRAYGLIECFKTASV